MNVCILNGTTLIESHLAIPVQECKLIEEGIKKTKGDAFEVEDLDAYDDSEAKRKREHEEWRKTHPVANASWRRPRANP